VENSASRAAVNCSLRLIAPICRELSTPETPETNVTVPLDPSIWDPTARRPAGESSPREGTKGRVVRSCERKDPYRSRKIRYSPKLGIKIHFRAHVRGDPSLTRADPSFGVREIHREQRARRVEGNCPECRMYFAIRSRAMLGETPAKRRACRSAGCSVSRIRPMQRRRRIEK